jgi:hypothetical protein
VAKKASKPNRERASHPCESRRSDGLAESLHSWLHFRESDEENAPEGRIHQERSRRANVQDREVTG